MKKLLLATFLMTSAFCSAHVVGVSDSGVYIRDQNGACKRVKKEKIPKKGIVLKSSTKE